MAGGAATGMGGNGGMSAYDQSAMAQQGALQGTAGILGQAGAMNPWAFGYDGGGYRAPIIGQGGAGTYAPRTTNGAGQYNAQAAQGPGTIASNMDRYQNPWETQVVDRTAAQMQRGLDEQLTGLQGNAAAAGAFGGARHGLTEARAMSDTNRSIGDMTAQLRQQGFDTAAGLSGQDIQNLQQNRQFNVGQRNTAAQFNAGNRQQNQQFNAGQRNAAAQFNAGNRQQTALADQQARQAAKQFGADARNTSRQFNAGQAQQLYGTNQDLGLGAARQLGELGQQSFGYGDRINQNLAADGAQAQQMQQALMGQAAGMFDKFLGQGMNTLNTRIGSLSLNPLNNAGTQTQQTTGLPSQGGGAMGVLGTVLPALLK